MKKSSWIPTLIAGFLLLALPTTTTSLDYSPDAGDGSISLEDEATRIGGLKTIFIGDTTLVTLNDIVWSPDDSVGNSSSLMWETSVNGVVQDSGMVELSEEALDLPTSISAGSIVVDKKQVSTVSVEIFLMGNPETSSSTSGDFATYGSGVSLVPLIIILLLASTTQMVELSLFLGIWLGACILTGSLAAGFKSTILDYLILELADEGHVMVIVFTVFLSGLVGMLQKSGGMLGFTNAVSKIAKTPRTAQFACMLLGVVIFFDDYANVLLTGQTLKPLMDVLFVSREKLSFIVDATAAPVASVSPVSSWVGYEAGLVQDAIDTLLERSGGEPLTIPSTGYGVFLESVRYSYYSLFMIGLIAMLVFTQRDYGPMLIAERKVRVYDRTDGGPGALNSGSGELGKENKPREDQPMLLHNMAIPIVVWIILVFVVLVKSGTIEGEEQTFLEKIEESDSYVALLYSTLGVALITLLLYLVQFTVPGTGTLAMPTPSLLKEMLPWNKAKVLEEGREPARFLMTVDESIESFLKGMAHVFLLICILTLAWSCGSIMTDVGTDRLFASWIISGGIPYQLLPVLTFIVALLIALSTGTSWGTMSILFPLMLVPTYEASNGEPQIFYATVSAVLGGAVAGDHMSPISDTTVLTALACDVNLMGHVNTQAPYVFWVVLFACLLGYIPIGYSAYPNIVGILLGWAACAVFVYFVCVPVISPTGSWDIFTKLCCARSKELELLAEDCVKKASAEVPEAEGEVDMEKPVGVEAPKEVEPVKDEETSM